MLHGGTFLLRMLSCDSVMESLLSNTWRYQDSIVAVLIIDYIQKHS